MIDEGYILKIEPKTRMTSLKLLVTRIQDIVLRLTRTFWLKLHLYVALSLGLLFAVLGVTGGLCVYADEIDAWLHPEFRITPVGQMQTPDRLLAAVKQAQPGRYGAWTLEMPRRPDAPLVAWFEKPRETTGAFYAPLMVAVNPYTGEVLGSRFWGQTLATQLIDLHAQLQYEAEGRLWVAFLGAALSLIVLSGVYLWLPKRGDWRGVFALRLDAGLSRFLPDLHRWLGLLSAGPLLLLAFTGFNLAYPPLLESLTASEGMGHGDAGPNVRSTALPSGKPISLAEAVLVARGLFPSAEVRRITTPQGDSGVYKINLRQKDEVNQHHPFTTVWLDRWSGQIREVRNPHRFSEGQVFSAWMWPLHTGEAFGPWGRVLWFWIGFTPLVLFVSGMWRWLIRRGVAVDRVLLLAEVRRGVIVLSAWVWVGLVWIWRRVVWVVVWGYGKGRVWVKSR